VTERARPEDIERVELTGETLTTEEVVAVARLRRPVSIAPAAARRVECCRLMVEALVDRGEKVYGLTTGFGKLRDISIATEDVQRLQVNLIRSHSVGVGPAFDEEVVRAALLLRANTLCRGNSGIRLEVIQAVLDLLRDGVYPYVPQQGSVGASGDLAPLSHLALVLMGDPEGRVLPRSGRDPADPGAVLRGRRREEFVRLGDLDGGVAAAALSDAPAFRTVTLQAKEGLALNNGTQFMTGLGCLVLHDAELGLGWAELATAMSLEAHRGVRHAFHPELHRARDLSHQAATAGRILAYTEGSEVLDLLLNTASLWKVRIFLEEAVEHLGDARAPTSADGAARVAGVKERIADLIGRLDALVPRDRTRPAPAEVVARRGDPPRAQIAAFEALLAPLLSRATSLLGDFEAPEFPSAPLAREAIVRAVAALSHAVPAAPPVQDDYSLRCAPQVTACAHRALAHAREVIEQELNSATDNPLLFPPEPPEGFDAATRESYARFLAEPAQAERLAERVLGGGNFHGEPIGKVLDYLAIALAEVASISERRVAQLVDEALSNGLPPFLIEESGLNSGFMIPQYTAASLVSENKVLCHPATADSIPTCAGSEDHVSMGTIAARQAAQLLDNCLHVVAIEVLAALQALEFRAPLRPGRGVAEAVAFLRGRGLAPVTEDRVLHPEILAVRELLRAPPPGC